MIPSLPGFGFSGPTAEPGWDTSRVARAWAELMRRLGYDRYGAQGGDFGAFVSPELGRIDPDHVVGVHVNAAWRALHPEPAIRTSWPTSPRPSRRGWPLMTVPGGRACPATP